MSRTSVILTWLATAVSLIGFTLCIALPWFSIRVRTGEQTIEADIFVWTAGSFRVPWHAWAAIILFLVGAFLARILAGHPRLNGFALAVIGAVILITLGMAFFPSGSAITIPEIHAERGAAPFAAIGAAILLMLVSIELFRRPNSHPNE